VSEQPFTYKSGAFEHKQGINIVAEPAQSTQRLNIITAHYDHLSKRGENIIWWQMIMQQASLPCFTWCIRYNLKYSLRIHICINLHRKKWLTWQ